MTGSAGLSLGLIGYPLGHSLSPRLHGAALQALGLSGEYRLYPLPPGPDLEPALARLLARMRRGEIDGLNVTVPHKQAVLSLLDECTPAARAIGAVNTMVPCNGRLVGDNTDAPGFLADLQRAFPALTEPAEAVVLGAGGAARAVVFALANAGWRVHIAARRVEQARTLAAGMLENLSNSARAGERSSPGLHAVALDAAGVATLQAVRLIVNATSAGMAPDIAGDPWPAAAPLPVGAAVYDLVYNPPETTLLRRARDAGLLAAGGLGMLVEQAALALERWTGLSVPRASMWAAVLDEKQSPPHRFGEHRQQD